ncbi:MAG: hypothetical protein ACRDHN_20710 [Thermomicrobiales bacterium]
MRYLRTFVRFWIDFVIGDAWEVALTVAVSLGLIWFIIDHHGGAAIFGYVLLAAILGITWIALLRTTKSKRR